MSIRPLFCLLFSKLVCWNKTWVQAEIFGCRKNAISSQGWNKEDIRIRASALRLARREPKRVLRHLTACRFPTRDSELSQLFENCDVTIELPVLSCSSCEKTHLQAVRFASITRGRRLSWLLLLDLVLSHLWEDAHSLCSRVIRR